MKLGFLEFGDYAQFSLHTELTFVTTINGQLDCYYSYHSSLYTYKNHRKKT